MTRKEAFDEMIRGKKVTHKYFSEEEYIYMEAGVITTEEGYSFISRWLQDENEEDWQGGWDLWMGPKKTLSVRGLWGYLIASGVKDVENRRTLKNIRGWHLIHVSKSYDKEIDLKAPSKLLNSEEIPIVSNALSQNALMRDSIPEKIKTGSIIGAMYIKDCTKDHNSKWAEEGVNNLVLDTSKSILFDKPVLDVKGKLSVWEYDLPQEYYEKYPQLKG